MEFFISAIRHYADFKGRCTRKPFWLFIVTTHVILMLLFTPLLIAATRIAATLLVEQPHFGELMESLAQQSGTDEELVAEFCSMGQTIAGESCTQLLSGHTAALICAGLAVLLGLLLIIPTLSITVRRVRDAGQSPWWVYLSLLSCIPLPGVAELGSMLGIVVFIFCWLPSRPAPEITTDRTPA